MITRNFDLSLLESLSEQQQELLQTLKATCQCVDNCGCAERLSEQDFESIRARLTLMQEEINRSQKITQELSQHLVVETALVSTDSEEFEYWCR